MQYQISYYSPKGRGKTLVDALCQLLPKDTVISNLAEAPKPVGDVQLVVFDFTRTNLKCIPTCVAEYLHKLEGKVIALFATVPFLPNYSEEQYLHDHLLAFLPRECDFKGLFLCGAEPTEALVRNLRLLISHRPEHTEAKHWLDRCEKAKGRPDNRDVQKACQFMQRVLEL